jgi:hypothetical protein
VILAATAVSFVLMQRRPTKGWDDTAGGALRVLVAPFHVEGLMSEWKDLALEDSLAARLGADSRLVARTDASAAASDYVLDGDVSPDGDRYVITLRLRPPGQRAAAWTATFWRRTLVDTALARELAAEVREAMRVKLQ